MCRQYRGFGIDEDLWKLPPASLTPAENLPPVQCYYWRSGMYAVGRRNHAHDNGNFRKDVSSLTSTVNLNLLPSSPMLQVSNDASDVM